jgi:hypothetical protein
MPPFLRWLFPALAIFELWMKVRAHNTFPFVSTTCRAKWVPSLRGFSGLTFVVTIPSVETQFVEPTISEILATFLGVVDTWLMCAVRTRDRKTPTSCAGSAPHARARANRNAIFSDAGDGCSESSRHAVCRRGIGAEPTIVSRLARQGVLDAPSSPPQLQHTACAYYFREDASARMAAVARWRRNRVPI